MKILSIGSDRNLFNEESAVSKRISEYGTLVEELHIVVFAKQSLGLKEKKIGTNVWVYPTNSLSKWFYIHNAQQLGEQIVFKNKFVRGKSLITTQDPFESGLVGLKVKNKWRIPLEVQLHTDPFSPYFNGFLNTIRKKIAKKVLKKADSLRVVSQNLADKIQSSTKLGKDDIKVLPIYVDKEKQEEEKILFDLHARFSWRFVLLSVSRLTKEKNLEFALKVLSLVRQKFPDTGMVLVGSGPEEKELRVLARRLDIEKNVVFEGWQEHLASYYKTANVYLQTSQFEGYGLSLVEAGLSGLPIVTSPVGIAQEMENGKELYICPTGNAQYFADAILDLLENNQKRQNLAINMKNLLKAKLFSKEEYLKELKSNWIRTASQI